MFFFFQNGQLDKNPTFESALGINGPSVSLASKGAGWSLGAPKDA